MRKIPLCTPSTRYGMARHGKIQTAPKTSPNQPSSFFFAFPPPLSSLWLSGKRSRSTSPSLKHSEIGREVGKEGGNEWSIPDQLNALSLTLHGGRHRWFAQAHDLYVPSVALSMWVVCSRACWMRDALSALVLALAGGDGYFIFTFMYSAYSPSDDNTGGEAVEICYSWVLGERSSECVLR